MTISDKHLGLFKSITRRDFLNGSALAIGGALGSQFSNLAHAVDNVPYPPALKGPRGQHDGSFEVMHAIRDGTFFDKMGTVQQTGENYDVVIVGAGIYKQRR